jgi:hypothetical protein
MQKKFIFVFSLALISTLVACSPRDFLTRRLASDLIASSDPFKSPQEFLLTAGVVSNTTYTSPERAVLQHHGWISATSASCPSGVTPSPCWNIILTPSGVDAVRSIVSADDSEKSPIAIPAAKRELVEVTGISKQGSTADVEFTWKWIPLNEIGEAIYPTGVNYKSTVSFRQYDDGWRVVQDAPRPAQTLDGAFKNAQPSR